MRTLAAVAVAAVIAMSCTELANADELGVIVACKHINPSQEYNEVNPGLYVRSGGWLVGGYKNSYSDPSMFFAHSWKWTKRFSEKWSASAVLDAGLLTGYALVDGRLNDGGKYGATVVPYVSPTLQLSYRNINANLHSMGTAVGLSFSYSY